MTRHAPTVVVSRVFDRVARVYDAPLLQWVVYRPVQDQVLDELRRHPPRRVLDVGCGTGILTARIHRELHPQAVYGCDASAGMLARARGRSPAVRWIEGTAEAIPLPDGAVDAVVSTTAFHFFDQPVALAEFRRVLAPGGVAVVATATAHTAATGRLLSAVGGATGVGLVPSGRDLRRMFAQAGLVVRLQARVARGPVGRGPVRRLDPMTVTVGVKPGAGGDEEASIG